MTHGSLLPAEEGQTQTKTIMSPLPLTAIYDFRFWAILNELQQLSGFIGVLVVDYASLLWGIVRYR